MWAEVLESVTFGFCPLTFTLYKIGVDLCFHSQSFSSCATLVPLPQQKQHTAVMLAGLIVALLAIDASAQLAPTQPLVLELSPAPVVNVTVDPTSNATAVLPAPAPLVPGAAVTGLQPLVPIAPTAVNGAAPVVPALGGRNATDSDLGTPTTVDPLAPPLSVRLSTCTDVPPGSRHTCQQQAGFQMLHDKIGSLLTSSGTLRALLLRLLPVQKDFVRASPSSPASQSPSTARKAECTDITPDAKFTCAQQAVYGQCDKEFMIQ
ncbi:hypothetical protein QJQ45_025927, partial [Haematococcus lacustris]